MTSGFTAAQTGRTHDHARPMLHKRQKVLAKAAPSTHDPTRSRGRTPRGICRRAATQLARRSPAGMSGTWGRPVACRAQEKSPGARPGLGRDVSKGKRLGLSPNKAVAKSAERPVERIALQIRRRHVLCPAQRVALVTACTVPDIRSHAGSRRG
jgi:hypothetical protein